MQALADWILQKLEDAPNVGHKAVYTYIDCEETFTDYKSQAVTVRRVDKVELCIFPPAGLPDRIGVSFTEPALGTSELIHIQKDAFAEEFPKWLAEQIEFLYHILSK